MYNFITVLLLVMGLVLCFLTGHVLIEAVDTIVYLGEIVVRNIKRRKERPRYYVRVK